MLAPEAESLSRNVARSMPASWAACPEERRCLSNSFTAMAVDFAKTINPLPLASMIDGVPGVPDPAYRTTCLSTRLLSAAQCDTNTDYRALCNLPLDGITAGAYAEYSVQLDTSSQTLDFSSRQSPTTTTWCSVSTSST